MPQGAPTLTRQLELAGQDELLQLVAALGPAQRASERATRDGGGRQSRQARTLRARANPATPRPPRPPSPHRKGGTPQSISNRSTPTLHQSTALPCPRPEMTSGAWGGWEGRGWVGGWVGWGCCARPCQQLPPPRPSRQARAGFGADRKQQECTYHVLHRPNEAVGALVLCGQATRGVALGARGV